MKFLHVSDLHIGKKLHNHSLDEDQVYILNQILDIAKDHAVDAILVAGDVYDKSLPSEKATEIFEDWITDLVKNDIAIYIISGNHDSRSRLGFGSRLFASSGIHLVTQYRGRVEKFLLGEGRDAVTLYMLPYVKLRELRKYFPDKDLKNTNHAFKEILAREEISPEEKNILMAHQHVDGGVISESEEIVIGGLDEVDACLFDRFSYVALGHLHKPQIVKSEKIRYSGSVLSYSKSEAASAGKEAKNVLLVEIDKEGKLGVEPIPLHPKRKLVIIRGRLADIARPGGLGSEFANDLVYFELTDEDPQVQVMQRLRPYFKYPLAVEMPGLLKNKKNRPRTAASVSKSPMENIKAFFDETLERELTDDEKLILENVIEDINKEESSGRDKDETY